MDIIKSGLWKLNHCDFVKGALIAVITGILTFFVEQLSSVGWVLDYKKVMTAAMIAFLSYLVKNLSTDHEGNLFGAVSLEKCKD
jgi:hypothetical protein